METNQKRGKSGPPKVEDLEEALAQTVDLPAGGAHGFATEAKTTRKNAALFSSASGCWISPPDVVDPLVEFCGDVGIALDPCSHPRSLVAAKERWFGPVENGITRAWPLHGVTYTKPPYGRALSDWAQKIQAEADRGCEIVALVPARTDTAWWAQMHPACWLAWEGRLTFLEPTEDWIAREARRAAEQGRDPRPAPAEEHPGLVRGDSATFPSALLYFGPRQTAFAATFGSKGRIYQDFGAGQEMDHAAEADLTILQGIAGYLAGVLKRDLPEAPLDEKGILALIDEVVDLFGDVAAGTQKKKEAPPEKWKKLLKDLNQGRPPEATMKTSEAIERLNPICGGAS